jgi:branched-subunit amino acid ABC-type transport system permease component
MMDLLQHVLNGITSGCILALVALGLTLAFGISRFANVAHGDYVTLGAFFTLIANQTFGWNLFLSGLVGILGCIVFGYGFYHFVFKPLDRRPKIASVIASIGVALVVRHAVLFIWGTEQHSYHVVIQRGIRFLGLRMTKNEMMILLTSFILMLTLHLILQKTRIGKEMRAVSDDPDLARVTGIESFRVTGTMWGLTLSLAAVAGLLLGLKTIITPYMGWDVLLPAFAAAILGGIGNPYGAMAGAILIGISEEVSTMVFPPSYRTAIAFIIMIFILMLRPVGIFGQKVEIK